MKEDMMNEIKRASWWFEAEMVSDVADKAISIVSTTDEVRFVFAEVMDRDTAMSNLIDFLPDHEWYIPRHTANHTLTVYREAPDAFMFKDLVCETDEYKGQERKIRVRGFGDIFLWKNLDSDIGEHRWFPSGITLLPREHSYVYSDGAVFYFDFMNKLGKFLDCDADQLRFIVASQNLMNSVSYRS